MHHTKRSQQPLYAGHSGHVFFPQPSIGTRSTSRGAFGVTSCKWACCQVTSCLKLILCKTARQVNTLSHQFLPSNVFGTEVCDSPSEIQKGLRSPIVIAVNDIERAMEKLGCPLHSGETFKNVKSSEYTYQQCCSVKKFLSLLGSNDQFKTPSSSI